MTHEFIGHNFLYETEQIILLFFSGNQNVHIKSTATTKDGFYIVETFIKDGNNNSQYCESAICETEKEKANAVKRSLYFAALKISKLDTPWGILTGIRPAKPIRAMLDEGKSSAEILKIYQNEYLVSFEKLKLAMSIAEKERTLISRNPKHVSVYIGIPFCPTRCIYCSFISHDAIRMKKLIPVYTEKLCREIYETGKIVKELGLNLRTLYFGGGTPTSLDENSLLLLTDAVAKSFDFKNLVEYTFEAGRPDTISEKKLEIIKNAGVNRISINPQTVHDKTLEITGRKHTFSDFLNAYNLARENGFKNINCDLIAALPGESYDDFVMSVDALTKLAPENITIHTLYIKRASFMKNSGIELPSQSEAAMMVDYGLNMCTQKGYNPYYLYKQKTTLGNLENVGYAKDGYECVYNIDTMSDTCSVLALGAGGVSKVVLDDRIERVFNYKNADEYISGFDEILKRKQAIKNLYMG